MGGYEEGTERKMGMKRMMLKKTKKEEEEGCDLLKAKRKIK